MAAEADRLAWLAGRGVATAKVVDHGQNEESAWLVTEAVTGITAASWPSGDLATVTRSLADAARMLHSLPIDGCPFRRDLATTDLLASARVEAGLVDLDNLEDQYDGWTGGQLLDELRRIRPTDENLVVCHGDLTPDNVLVDPDSGQLTGLIDVGGLGLADRWLDLAILYRELSDGPFDRSHAAQFLRRYGVTSDPAKMSYYVLLDEFF
ncbi:APH(3') family aminoglycoside O-phosphotransferase [Kribbella sp. NPDC056861]|uniref:APH(3') family aminoglycoside O-phosphotransferase n=1 Tax=Kribbella sp. NPDC056861 TaxID=3154857 RepID=UPI0034171672